MLTQDSFEVLPLIRCPDCGKPISTQSVEARSKIDVYQEQKKKETARLGLSRGMTRDEYNTIIPDIIDAANLIRPCCKNSIIEQHLNDIVPTYIERYIPGEGTPIGNVKLRLLPDSSRYLAQKPGDNTSPIPAIPYNPYSFTPLSLNFEPVDESEDIEMSKPVKSILSIRDDIFPSMPGIDNSFEEELPPSRKELIVGHVAGLINTGLPKYESVLIRGRPIPAS